MLKKLALVIAFAGLLPAAALAHGPTRQKVTESVEINAPADKVWAAVGNFQDMGWTGIATKTEGTGDNTVGATRKLTVPNGTLDEKLIKYNADGKILLLRTSGVRSQGAAGLELFFDASRSSADGDKSKVEWKGAFYRSYVNNDPPPEENDEAAVKAVTGLYQAALGNLKKKLEGGG